MAKNEPLMGEERMAAGKRWTSMPKRVLFMAILIPVLGVSGAGSEATGTDSGASVVAAMAVGKTPSQTGLSSTRVY